MATHRLPILGAFTVPDASGDVFFEPYSIKAAIGLWEHLVAIFNDTSARDGLRGLFNVPQNYVDTANLIIVWTSTAITGDVDWDFDYRAVGGNDTESLDQATAQEQVTGNDIAPSAAHERMELSISLTDGNFAAGDTVPWELFRDGVTEGGGGISAAVILVGLFFEYNDA